jgi:hypothetical protein
MKRMLQFLLVVILLLPLTLSAEVATWLLPTTYVDNTTISATDKARITIYLRGYKKGSPATKTYFGETRNGLETWGVAGDNTYIMTKMNQWGVINNVPGWVNIVPGDNVFVTLSAAITWVDNVGVVREYDGPESVPYAWTIYKAGVTPPPPPPPPPPPITPSCTAPTGVTIKP